MAETMKTLVSRRSVRAYQAKQVDEKALAAVLEAGSYAPSAMGKQGTVMVVVQDKAVRDELSRMNAQVMNGAGDPFYGAPTAVIVFADPAVSCCPVQDASLVMGNLLNAAFDQGLDSCWINRAKEMFESAEGKKYLAKWGLSEACIGVGICILGYRAAELPAPAPRSVRIVRA